MCLCSESQGSAIHELSPHTWPVSKAGQSVSPPKQGCVDPPPPPVSTAGPPGFPLPACVQGKATWVPTPYLCPRRGHLSPTPRLCPRQGHLGSHSPPVSKAGPPGFPLPACVQGRATRVPTPRLCPRQGHPGSRSPPVSTAGPHAPPTCAPEEEVGTGTPSTSAARLAYRLGAPRPGPWCPRLPLL